MSTETANKTAIVVMSDPKGGGEEALGRVFNALAVAYELDQSGDTVRIQFQGAGSRWPQLLADPTHPANALYETVRHTVAGVSCGCADLFGASTGAQDAGMALITDNPVPGTTGLASIRALIHNNFTILSF
jgi:hypothetical protein